MATKMSNRKQRERLARSARSMYALESSRSREERLFKHKAVNEIIDLLKNKHPWKMETRAKVVEIANKVRLTTSFVDIILQVASLFLQVIEDLQPFQTPYNPFNDNYLQPHRINYREIIIDLKTVIGIINTPIFQVVATYEALSLSRLIKYSLKKIDGDISLSDESKKDSDEECPRYKNVSPTLSNSDIRTSRFDMLETLHATFNALTELHEVPRTHSGERVREESRRSRRRKRR